MYNQVRIDTGFRRFTELDQIFNNKFIFLVKNFKLSELKSGKGFGQSVNILSEWIRNLGKGIFRELKSQKNFPEEHALRPP